MAQSPWDELRAAAPATPPAPAPAVDPWAELRTVAPARPTTSTGIVIRDAKPEVPNPLHTLAPAVMRVGGAIAGGVLGTAVGGPGVGTAVGSVAGGGLGEWAAEGYEDLVGLRDGVNPAQIATQAAINAIPFGTAAKGVSTAGRVMRGAAQGAALGGAADVATNLAEGRGWQAPSLTSLGLGLVLGGAGGAAAARVPALRAAADDVPTPVPTPDVPPVVTPDVPPVVAQADVPPAATNDVDDLLKTLGVSDDAAARVQVDDPRLSMNNASGGSAASMEALSRQAGMRERGESFVVIRPDGTKTPLIGPDAVDYKARPGESYGIEGPDGFRLLDGPQPANLAPRATNTTAIDAPAPTQILESGTVDDLTVRTPREPLSPEAARVARVVNQEGLPPTSAIPESRRITEQMVRRFPEEHRDDLLGIIEKNNAFEYQRRGVQSDARRAALAQHLQMDLSTRLRPGTILNAEEYEHLGGAVLGAQERVKELAARVSEAASAGRSDAFDLFNLAAAKQELTTLMASFMGTRAEIGRAQRVNKFMAQILRSGDLGAIRKILAEHPDLKNVEGFADEFLKRGSDVEKMDYALGELRKNRSWLDTALAVYYANVLSGVKTHLRNLMGSGSNILFREVSNAVGVGYDVARSKITGAPRTMFAEEIPARAVGAFQGVRKGLADAAFVLKHGYGQEALAAFDTPRVELAGGAKNPFNLPGRLLEAEDALMYRMVYEAQVAGRLQSQARAAAVKAGVSGPEADRMVGDFVAERMLAVPKDVADAAQDAAQRALFREKPGYFTSKILDLKKSGPMGKALSFIVPFVRVPGSIFRQALENNLVGGFLTQQGRAALRAGGREQAEMVGRMVTGTAALGVLATWVAQGRVSGGGPSNPNERAALMETGWKPYSVNIPGVGWVDYNLLFQSVALPLSSLANAWEMYTATGDEKALDDLAVSSVMSMGGTLLDQSFLSGASDFNAAMTAPEQFAKNWAARTAQGFVPLSGLQRNVAQTIDPTVRDTSDPSLVRQVGKGVQSVVPGLSDELPARLDRFGQPVERTGGRAAGMSPITASTPNTDPVVQGLERLGIRSIGLPAKEIGKEGSRSNPRQVLTPEERAAMGQAVHTALEQLFRTSLDALEQMDPAAAEARVQRVVDDARARVRAEIQRERRTR